MGCDPCSADTGAYCRARAKLPEAVIRRLAVQVGQKLEEQVPADWLWHGRHVKLADGTTLTMPDTAANQAAYPQSTSQKPGLGFPIVRMVVLLSLATACCATWRWGRTRARRPARTPCCGPCGKQLHPGDILLADRLYCSYCLLAVAQQRNVDCVVRLHQRRKADFRRGQCIARGDRVVEWQRPARPEWMDEATYATIPRDACVCGKSSSRSTNPASARRNWWWSRPCSDGGALSHAGHRPTVSLPLECGVGSRALKQSLAMDHLRCKSPEMVRKEIWMAWLGYNLTAQEHRPSGPAAWQTAAADRLRRCACRRSPPRGTGSPTLRHPCVRKLAAVQFEVIASHNVGDRPNRVEPRAVKRRGKPHQLLTKPREEARQKLLAARRKRR